MVRYGYLYEKVIAVENLSAAASVVCDTRKDKEEVARFEAQREQRIMRIHEELEAMTFKFGPYRIFEKTDGKRRLIADAKLDPDRIVHQAILNICEPIWMKVFTKNNYACLKKRGIHGAAKAVRRIISSDPKGACYALQIDIRKFYQSIIHDVLMRVLSRKIKDEKMMWLLGQLIDSYEDGIPIGNSPSAFFANLLMAYLDHHLKERCGVEYDADFADDWVFFSGSKEFLHGLRILIERFLWDEFGLMLKDNWAVYTIAMRRGEPGRGVDFVGYVFYMNQTLMRKSVKQKYARAVVRYRKIARIPKNRILVVDFTKSYKNNMELRSEGISHPDEYRKMCRKVASYYGWTKHCNGRHFTKKINVEIISRKEKKKRTKEAA